MVHTITYHSRVGQEISKEVFLFHKADPDYCTVVDDDTGSGLRVVTRWTGDAEFDGDDIYENVVYEGEDPFVVCGWLAETRAVECHRWLVKELGGAR